MTGTVKASYSNAGEVRVLMVPAWVRNPTVLPRQDGEDTISIEVTQRFPQERWLVIRGTSVSQAVAFCLLGQGKQVVSEADVQMTVYVPLSIYTNLRIQRVQARS
ncbi:MAG TPA: hypothetical protein VJM46_01275 [Candidatus Saccharimonadales bacterium]|nr:hypothetical protein [Candidatus Saccharimonadales bacterium]